MTALNCAFNGNVAQGSNGGLQSNNINREGGTASGGAINNQGTLALTNCTLTGNQCIGGDAGQLTGNFEFTANGGDSSGAAIASTGASVILVNCTVSGNVATGGNGTLNSGAYYSDGPVPNIID